MSAIYDAARVTRFNRIRGDLGGSGDSHLTDQDLWNLRERAREYERNGTISKALFQRIADNVVRTGFDFQPKTGEIDVNQALKAKFDDWANDKNKSDSAGKFTFSKLTQINLASMLRDGDYFNVLHRGKARGTKTLRGTIQGLEGDRCVSPGSKVNNTIEQSKSNSSNPNIILGVEVDAMNRPEAYHFTRHPSRTLTSSKRQIKRTAARFDDGSPQVLHMFDPDRYSMTRSVSGLVQAFDLIEKIEDSNFAELVRLQISGCVAMFLGQHVDTETRSTLKFGPQETVNVDSSNTDTLEEFRPGMVVHGRPGETLEGFSPNIPNAEFLPFTRRILRMIAMEFGIPYELLMLDTTDTTFHGYRGVLVEARKRFQWLQQILKWNFLNPSANWIINIFLEDDDELADLVLKAKVNPFEYTFQSPGFPYVDPLKDVMADALAIASNLISPSEAVARQGGVYSEVIRQKIEDMALAILLAIEAAQEITDKTKVEVDYRLLLNTDLPRGVTVNFQNNDDIDESSSGNGGNSNG